MGLRWKEASPLGEMLTGGRELQAAGQGSLEEELRTGEGKTSASFKVGGSGPRCENPCGGSERAHLVLSGE